MAQLVDTQQTVQESRPKRRRNTTFLHALAFVIGFSIVFVILGSAAGLLGQSLNRFLPAIQRVGAVLLLIFALSTLGVFRRLALSVRDRTDPESNRAAAGLIALLEFFNRLMYTERRVTELHKVKRGWGYLSSTLMGMSFSAGWVPCVGPILAGILFVASDSATAASGAVLLLAYSLGLGIPFLITGAAFGRASRFLRRLNRHANIVSIISGIFLLYVAWLLWSDQLTTLTSSFAFLTESVIQLETVISASLGFSTSVGADVIGGIPVAFVAGLISFLSPCVLPLIPAYLGYLSGATLNQGATASEG